MATCQFFTEKDDDWLRFDISLENIPKIRKTKAGF